MPIVTMDTHTGITSMSTGYFLSKDSYTSDVLPLMLRVSSWWLLVSSLCVFRFSLCSWLFSKVIELCSANYKIKSDFSSLHMYRCCNHWACYHWPDKLTSVYHAPGSYMCTLPCNILPQILYLPWTNSSIIFISLLRSSEAQRMNRSQSPWRLRTHIFEHDCAISLILQLDQQYSCYKPLHCMLAVYNYPLQ